MKKQLIATAVLSAFAAASMAANVELFGQIDTYIAVNKTSGHGTEVKMNSGGTSASHWGLKGMEVLNDTTQVMFQMDSAILSDNGAMVSASSGQLFDRECWVGVHNNNYGMFSFGRQYTPHFLTWATTDMTYLSLGSSHSPYFFPSGTGVNGDAGDGGFVRHSNSFFYASPNMAGATVMGYVALGEQKTGKTCVNGNIYNLAVNYANGPFYIMGSVLYHKLPAGTTSATGFAYETNNAGYYVAEQDPSAMVENPRTDHDWYFNLGATYDFGVAKVGANFMYKKADDSYKYPEQHAFHGRAINPDFWVAQLGTNIPCWGGALSLSGSMFHNSSDSDGNAWGLGGKYLYPFSKRTKAYVGFQYVNNSEYTRFTPEAGPDSSFHFATENGKNVTQFFFGVNHTF